jgi:hypothetical protein
MLSKPCKDAIKRTRGQKKKKKNKKKKKKKKKKKTIQQKI